MTASDDRSTALQRAVGDVYEVRRLIGRGGFAEVYEAYEPRLKRSVAIKVLGADLSANPEMLDRFRREAEAVARLRHPHIVPIYNVGDATGLAWYVMPLVEGESLRDWLERERPLPPADAWRILREVAAALAVAHRAGFVHRDVKPENIMLDGDERRALVMDFGIARAVAAEADREKLTATGIAIGTPRYMSPEQAAGEPVDARSDVYSVGVVGYEMLSGRLPYEGSSFRDVMIKQATETPPPLAELAPSAAGSLVAAIERALERDPAKRFANATELAAALEPPAATGPSLSSPTLNVAERVPVWVRRTLAAAGVAGLVTAAALHTRAEPWTRIQGITRGKAAQIAGEFLYANDVRGPYDEYIRFTARDTLVGYLDAALGPAAGAAWAAKHYPAYEWRVSRFYADSSGWMVAVDMAGKVRAARHRRPEGRRQRVPADSALRTATAWLAKLGLTEGELLRTDSTKDPGLEHRFLWRMRRDTVPWSGAPVAAHQEVAVTTSGGRVTRYEHRLAIPDSFPTIAARQKDRSMWIALLLILPAILVILSTIRWRRRQGEDVGREKLARNLCFMGAAIATLAFVVEFNALRGSAGGLADRPDTWFTVIPTMVAMSLLAILAALMVFTIDQNVRQHYPGLIAGYLEIGAGRLTGRPMAAGWMAAYGLGGILAAASALGYLALAKHRTRADITFDAPNAYNHAVPLSGLTELITAFAMPAFLLMILLAMTRLTRREVAPALAVIGLTLAEVASTEAHRGIVLGLSLALYSVGAVFLLRFGLLVAAWGLYIASVLASGLTLLAASSAGFQVAGIVTLAFVALPGVLGVISERRLRGSLSGVAGARTPSAA